MANPQCDKEYTKLSNELINAFCRYRVPGEVMQIVWAVIRQTYGWHKKTDRIALSQFVQLTGMKKPNIVRALSKAITNELIFKTNTGKYGFQKDYDAWKSFGVIKSDNDVIKSDNNCQAQKLSEVIPTKEIKETLQKKEVKDLILQGLDKFKKEYGRA